MKPHLYIFTFLLFSSSVCVAQETNRIDTNIIQPIHYPWFSLGVSVGRQYNYAHVQNRVPIPRSGTSKFVAVPVVSFGLRIQREFAPYWLWRGGIDVSEFGLRLSTTYAGSSQGRAGHFESQTQISFALQHYFLHSATTRPYLRLGVLANVNTGPPSRTFISFSRRLSGSPTYRDLIVIDMVPWLRPGLIVGLGFSRRIRSGFMFDVAFVAYRGFFKLANISYTVERDDGMNSSQEVLSTEIVNRGSFLGLEANVYLPPFKFKKTQRRLKKQQFEFNK